MPTTDNNYKLPAALNIVVNGDGSYSGDFLKGMTFLASCSEATVYRDGSRVIKIMEPYNDRDLSTFRVRVNAAIFANTELGDGSLKLIGFYNSPNGTPNPVLSQNFIDGRDATKEEIQAYMTLRGWQLSVPGKHTDEYEKNLRGSRLTAKDLDGDNVKVTSDGAIFVIDACIYENQPSQTPHQKKAPRFTNC